MSLELYNAEVLGIFIQDQTLWPTSSFLVCVCLERCNVKDAVAKSKHVWQELIIIRGVAVCILVIRHSCLSWMCTCLCDVMRQALPTRILTLSQMPQMDTSTDPSNNTQKSFEREVFLKYHYHKKIHISSFLENKSQEHEHLIR